MYFKSNNLNRANQPRPGGSLEVFIEQRLDESNQDFKEFIAQENIWYPEFFANLKPADDQPPSITGEMAVDNLIRQVAESRGYRRQSAVADVSKLVSPENNRHLLQPEVAAAYLNLKKELADLGAEVSVSSAYRSHDRQQQIFLGVCQEDYSLAKIGRTLKTISIPGYSKHHSGYVLDLIAGDLIFYDFLKSKAYQLMVENNCLLAKRHGFLPSYPEGISLQGPDPEPWEWAYLGADLIERFKDQL